MDDLELVNKILDGDEKAFEILFYKYGRQINNYIYANVKDIEATEDIVQEVFISVYNKLFTFNHKNSFKPWLYAIARNKTIDYIRKNKKVIFVDIDNINHKVLEQRESIDSRIELKETQTTIESFIKTLNDKNRELLYLKYYNPDITFGKLSEILNTSEGAVKRRYYSIHKKYIEYLKKSKSWGGDSIEV